jgi:hypothetical protein
VLPKHLRVHTVWCCRGQLNTVGEQRLGHGWYPLAVALETLAQSMRDLHVGFIPLLGWLNWFAIPVSVVGLVLGLMGWEASGRHINLVVLALAMIRLAPGGGIL